MEKHRKTQMCPPCPAFVTPQSSPSAPSTAQQRPREMPAPIGRSGPSADDGPWHREAAGAGSSLCPSAGESRTGRSAGNCCGCWRGFGASGAVSPSAADTVWVINGWERIRGRRRMPSRRCQRWSPISPRHEGGCVGGGGSVPGSLCPLGAHRAVPGVLVLPAPHGLAGTSITAGQAAEHPLLHCRVKKRLHLPG